MPEDGGSWLKQARLDDLETGIPSVAMEKQAGYQIYGQTLVGCRP